MSLTGPVLATLLIIAAISALIGVFFVWARVPGPRWTRRGLRFGLLLINQILAVLVVAVLANDAGEFYTSWTDLFGHGGSAPTARPQPRIPPATPAGLLTADDTGYAARREWPVRGRLLSITMTGAASQLRAAAYVYLPPQYFQPSYSKTTFPAVELLSGYGTPAATLATRGGAPDTLVRLIRSGAMPPVILVITTAAPGDARDTQCTDVPSGPQAETFVATDVPLAIADAYRVAPIGWGVVGVGEGGYCAAKLTMLHSDVFYAGASIDGYFTPHRTATTGDLWGRSSVVRRLADLAWRLHHLPAPPTRLLLLGPDHRTDQAFAALARHPMQVVVHGGAPADTISQALSVALPWLGRYLPPPA